MLDYYRYFTYLTIVIKTKTQKMPMPEPGTGNTHHSRHEKRGCADLNGTAHPLL